MSKSASVHKILEVVGTSKKSFSDAAQTAVARAAESVRGLEWFEVTEQRGRIDGAKIAEFQVTMKIGFKLE
ncbi:MAG: dodecin family protein [Planctomycetes bacterium]|nr:dodecin family protein [Planctomycetota bacterium]